MTAFIRRREFVTLLGGAAAWPLAARAQQAGPVRHIGVLLVDLRSDGREARQFRLKPWRKHHRALKMATELYPKRLQLLKDVNPQLRAMAESG